MEKFSDSKIPEFFFLLLFLSIFNTTIAFSEDLDLLYIGAGWGKEVVEDVGTQENSAFDLCYFTNYWRFKDTNTFFLIGASYTFLRCDTDLHNENHVLSVLPTLRHYFKIKDHDFFLHLSIGPSIMSSRKLGYVQQGETFAFNDYVGFGFVPENSDWEVMLMWRHLSNAGIFKPNHGYNVHFNLGLCRYF